MLEVGAREGSGSWRSEQEGGLREGVWSAAQLETGGGVATMGSFVFLIVVMIHDIKSVILTNFSVQFSGLNCIHFVVQLSPGCRWCRAGRRQGAPPGIVRYLPRLLEPSPSQKPLLLETFHCLPSTPLCPLNPCSNTWLFCMTPPSWSQCSCHRLVRKVSLRNQACATCSLVP